MSPTTEFQSNLRHLDRISLLPDHVLGGLPVDLLLQLVHHPRPDFRRGVFFSLKELIFVQNFGTTKNVIPFCFCIHCCSYFLHRGRLSSGTANKTYHFWFQSLAPKMECTQQKFALEMTREWSFLLSLSKKWPKKIILAMCFSVPSIGLL